MVTQEQQSIIDHASAAEDQRLAAYQGEGHPLRVRLPGGLPSGRRVPRRPARVQVHDPGNLRHDLRVVRRAGAEVAPRQDPHPLARRAARHGRGPDGGGHSHHHRRHDRLERLDGDHRLLVAAERRQGHEPPAHEDPPQGALLRHRGHRLGHGGRQALSGPRELRRVLERPVLHVCKRVEPDDGYASSCRPRRRACCRP